MAGLWPYGGQHFVPRVPWYLLLETQNYKIKIFVPPSHEVKFTHFYKSGKDVKHAWPHWNKRIIKVFCIENKLLTSNNCTGQEGFRNYYWILFFAITFQWVDKMEAESFPVCKHLWISISSKSWSIWMIWHTCEEV